MKKPTPVTLSYYEYKEVEDYIHNKYNLDKKVFKDWVVNLKPYDGELMYFHIGDYIAYKKYDTEELLEWFKAIETEFDSFVIIEWED